MTLTDTDVQKAEKRYGANPLGDGHGQVLDIRNYSSHPGRLPRFALVARRVVIDIQRLVTRRQCERKYLGDSAALHAENPAFDDEVLGGPYVRICVVSGTWHVCSPVSALSCREG
jgi:hypothetical protein